MAIKYIDANDSNVIRQEMVLETETKNTYVYVPANFGMPVGRLYVHRLAFPGGAPRRLILTLTTPTSGE